MGENHIVEGVEVDNLTPHPKEPRTSTSNHTSLCPKVFSSLTSARSTPSPPMSPIPWNAICYGGIRK